MIGIDSVICDFIKRHNLAVEALTDGQLAEALRQAIACGDFARYVRVTDNGQKVDYMPYRRATEMATKYDRMAGCLSVLAKCDFNDSNCSGLDVASARVRKAAQAALSNECLTS